MKINIDELRAAQKECGGVNGSTLEIKKLLGVSLQIAVKVQENMSCDFSQCTQREFNRAAHDALATLEWMIGNRFAALLRAELGAKKFAEVQKRNTKETDKNICHSHDFCDANMVMAPAFQEVMGREIDLQCNSDTALWGAAWNFAVRQHLSNGRKIY